VDVVTITTSYLVKNVIAIRRAVMNEQVERLEALSQEQQELIKELENENRCLKARTQILSNRIQELEQQRVVIDREMAEIPIGFDLIPEEDLNKY
jgi:capsule polysaccharide export protein KpsE/RkpR